MADYLMIFLVTDIIFLALVVLLIWRDWSMPMPTQRIKRPHSRIN